MRMAHPKRKGYHSNKQCRVDGAVAMSRKHLLSIIKGSSDSLDSQTALQSPHAILTKCREGGILVEERIVCTDRVNEACVR